MDQRSKPANISAVIEARREPRSDGYRPISDQLWASTALWGFPVEGTSLPFRLYMSGARRIDSGHRQIERVREGLDEMPDDWASPAARQQVHQIVGDAEMAIWAIDNALKIALCVADKEPQLLKDKEPIVTELRDHFSHIDERALGQVHRKPNPKAQNAFDLHTIIVDREFTTGSHKLGIDAEMTSLCITIRDLLVSSWAGLPRGTQSSAEGPDI